MSLISKLFRSKKRKDPTARAVTAENQSNVLAEWDQEPLDPCIPFNKKQVRMVVFYESERRGRQVLFDSAGTRPAPLLNGHGPPGREDAVVPGSPVKKNIPVVNIDGSPQDSSLSSTKSLEEQRKTVAQAMRTSRSDSKMLGEMIFGSIPITVRSVISKVHELRSPPKIMLTKVYPVFEAIPRADGEANEDDIPGSRISESRSSFSSEDSLSLHSPPGIHQIPDRISRRGRSGVSTPILTPSPSSNSLPSMTFSPPSMLGKFEGGAAVKRQKRFNSLALETGVKMLLESTNEDDFVEGYSRKKRTTAAIACLVALPETDKLYRASFQEFLFTHSPVFEYAMNLFKSKLEIAMTDRRKFMDLMWSAYDEVVDHLVGFVSAYRLPRPMWLVIAMEKLSDESYIAVLRLRLVLTMAELWTRHDTKETQFFFSRLITAVLAGHLGWVSTVTPSNSQTTHYKLKHEPQWIQLLAKSHPYNPLWAQLGDLLGICGSPARLTKTILVSRNQTLLNAYLHLLSYFVRTSDVAYHRFEPVEPVLDPVAEVSPQRLRRFQSGDNPNFRPNAIFKHKHQSGSSRPRLQSLNETALGSRSRRNFSMSKRNSEDSTASGTSDGSVFEGKTRHVTSGSMGKPALCNGISHSGSTASIPEEGVPVFPETGTDDRKWEMCAVVMANVRDPRKRRYTTGANYVAMSHQDSVDETDGPNGIKPFPRPPRHRIINVNKFPEKPLILHLQEHPISYFKPAIQKPKFDDLAFENAAAFATSMLSAPRDTYSPHFALQGCCRVDEEQVAHDLQVAAEYCLTDEPCAEASAIIADLDKFTVKVVSCGSREVPRGITLPVKSASVRSRTEDCAASSYIMQVLETTVSLSKLKTTPEFCLMHLEDRLQELYVSSCAMVTFIQHQTVIDTKEMMELLGLEMSDFPLLKAVASTHAPDVISDLNLVNL